MHVAVGKVKAAWEYGNSLHSFSHGYLKKIQQNHKKNPSLMYVTWLGLAVGALRTFPGKPTIFLPHLVQDKKDENASCPKGSKSAKAISNEKLAFCDFKNLQPYFCKREDQRSVLHNWRLDKLTLVL